MNSNLYIRVCTVWHAQDTVIQEAVIMKRQRHPHILELLAVFVDGSDLWMIIPLVPGGSLESLIKKGYQKVYLCHYIILQDVWIFLHLMLYSHRLDFPP